MDFSWMSHEKLILLQEITFRHPLRLQHYRSCAEYEISMETYVGPGGL